MVEPLYTSTFLPVFDEPQLSQFDRWYGQHDNGLGSHPPQFSPGKKYENRGTMQVPFPLVCSIICTIYLENAEALVFEDKLRTISKWKLLNALYSVPYGTPASIMASNLTEACKYGKIIGKKLPCWPLCRHSLVYHKWGLSQP
jgi:hypothetical protein